MPRQRPYANARTNDVLAELRRAWSFGETPSQREVARRLGVHLYTVHRASKRLKADGILHPDTRVLAQPDLFNLNHFLTAVYRNKRQILKHGFSNVEFLDDDQLKTRLLLHIAEAIRRGITIEELTCHNVRLSKQKPASDVRSWYKKTAKYVATTGASPPKVPGRLTRKGTS